MKPLIIHPRDPETDVLKFVYQDLDGDLITEVYEHPANELKNRMLRARKVYLLGHGTPQGLLTNDLGKPFIDNGYASYLSCKDNLYIFCHADMYVKENRLTGFCTGMFISQQSEALTFKVPYEDDWQIEESNELFANLVNEGEKMGLSSFEMVDYLSRKYRFADSNPICDYNRTRLWAYRDGVLVNWTIDAEITYPSLLVKKKGEV